MLSASGTKSRENNLSIGRFFPQRIHTFWDRLREARLSCALALPLWPRRALGEAHEGFVVGMTSYPPRIRSCWKAVETLLRQDIRGVPVALVLSSEEFPDHKIPWKLRQQTRRGLTILWTEGNGRSFDKLLPLRVAYPDHSIITVDDDKYYPHDLARRLIRAHLDNPGHIVGARGWRVTERKDPRNPKFGANWKRALPGDSGRGLHIPGGNGCLYPPGTLNPIVDDFDLATRLCPDTDDIWFWAAAHLNETPFYCLGMPEHRPISSMAKGPALYDKGRVSHQEQFQAVLEYFSWSEENLRWRPVED